MTLTHPILLAIAAVLATVGLFVLFRPPRRRIEVANLSLWREAATLVKGRSVVRRATGPLLLIALGALWLAASVGGMVLRRAQSQREPALLLIAQTPHLYAQHDGRANWNELDERWHGVSGLIHGADDNAMVISNGRRTLAILTDLHMDGMPDSLARGFLIEQNNRPGTPPDAAELLRAYRHRLGTAVYLFGEFTNVPQGDTGVQWVYRPRRPGSDVGIIAAGADRVDDHVELLVAVRRFAGDAATVGVRAFRWEQAEALLATGSINFAAGNEATLVLRLPGDLDGPIHVALVGNDDQPMNDEFFLAPVSAGGVGTMRLTGRSADAIERAIRGNPRLRSAEPGESADWLIVHEPAEPLAPGATGATVMIDPLVAPAGAEFVGQISDVTIAAVANDRPWATLPLDGVRVKRATRAKLDPAVWRTVAADNEGNPLIAWDPGAAQLLVLFSLAPGNSDFASHLGWPLFWDALAELRAGGARQITRWTGRPGEPGRVDGKLVNLPESAYEHGDPADVARINSADIRPPPQRAVEATVPLWAILTVAGTVGLALGWTWSARRGG
jgi:hypothetical protein